MRMLPVSIFWQQKKDENVEHGSAELMKHASFITLISHIDLSIFSGSRDREREKKKDEKAT